MLAIAILGLSIGLVVGTRYWLAVAARLERNPLPTVKALPIAVAAQYPILLFVITTTGGVVTLIRTSGWLLSNGVAAIVTVFAALEYVNYYPVQLQHFDNSRDWRRLLSGRGFRRAHLARDLARWRRRLRPLGTNQ